MNAPIRKPSQLSVRKTLTGKEEIFQLAQMSGVNTAFMRKFVKEAVAVIETGLLRDGVVKIHNFGTFRLLASGESYAPALKPPPPQVVFQPVKNLRRLIIRAFGPTVHTGSRVSLQTLMEKHLEFAASPPAPAIKKPAREKFDIAEVLTELANEPPARFATAETADDIKEKFDAELIAAPASDTAPTFTLAETVDEAEPVLAPTDSEFEQLFETPAPPLRRRRRFVWYAGAFAILLLLLLLLPGRIAEQQESASRSVVNRTPTQTNGLSSQNKSDKIADGHVPISTTPAKPLPFFAGGSHRVAPGDNLWGVSGQYYRDHYLWPNVYRANTAAIKNPDILEIDQQLAVPILHGPPEKLTLDDRRNLADGYFLLYRYYKTNDPALAPFALWAAVRYDARIKKDFAAELREDDWAFLQAHIMPRQVAER